MFLIGEENGTLAAVTLLIGGLLALALGGYRAVRAKVPAVKILSATVLAPLAAAFMSHLLCCVVNLDYVLQDHALGYIFAFWQKGYMVYGGIIGAALALAAVGGKDRFKMLEQFAPSAAFMIAAARVAEGFMGQGYGEYFEGGETIARFPFMVYDPYYEEWAWALFTLEALIALGLCVYLLARRKTWQGDGALMLLGIYASVQIVLESLRRDEFLRWGFVRVEEVFSAVAVLFALVCYCVRAGKVRGLSKALCFALYAAMIVLCLLLEFATEGRIPFLEFLSPDGCYITMAGACAVLCGCVIWMRRICSLSKNAKEPAL